jgi:membrane protein
LASASRLEDWLLFAEQDGTETRLAVRVGARAAGAIVGALAATLLWELGKIGFGFYVAYAAGYGKWYGNLGLIPLFMFWLYLTWIFLLLGVEVAYIQQHFRLLVRRQLNARSYNTPLIDSHWVLPLAVLLVQQFRKGQTVNADLAAKNLHLSPHTAAEFLTALQQAGLVHALDGEETEYALAKAPETITLRDLLHAVGHRCQTLVEASRAAGADHPLLSTPVLLQMQEVQEQWAAGRTMADLAAPASVPVTAANSPAPQGLAAS